MTVNGVGYVRYVLVPGGVDEAEGLRTLGAPGFVLERASASRFAPGRGPWSRLVSSWVWISQLLTSLGMMYTGPRVANLELCCEAASSMALLMDLVYRSLVGSESNFVRSESSAR